MPGSLPFGLSIVVPVSTGPFHLGNVVVRAKIAINLRTAAAMMTSESLPQVKDGVPFRLPMVSVDINRPNFFFDATNCESQNLTATAMATATQSAIANASSPFQPPAARASPSTNP
jgi:hypothetical protein